MDSKIQGQRDVSSSPPIHSEPQSSTQPQHVYSQPQQTYVQPQQIYTQLQPNLQLQQTYAQPQQTYTQLQANVQLPAYVQLQQYPQTQPPATGQMYAYSANSQALTQTVAVNPALNEHQQLGPAPVVVVAQSQEQDCLVWSVLSCIFLNAILGIIAVIFSVLARDHFDRGNIQAGRSNAKVAKVLNIVSLSLAAVAVIVAVIVVAVTASSTSRVTAGVTSYAIDNYGGCSYFTGSRMISSSSSRVAYNYFSTYYYYYAYASYPSYYSYYKYITSSPSYYSYYRYTTSPTYYSYRTVGSYSYSESSIRYSLSYSLSYSTNSYC